MNVLCEGVDAMDKITQLSHRRSKLILCSRDYMNKVTADMYFYVESYHYEPMEGIPYLDILAPSLEIYGLIERSVRNKHITAENVQIFKESYKKQLETEVATRILKRIEFYLQRGKDIVLICDPVDLRFNHLLIVGNYFKELDYVVDFKFTLASMNLHNFIVSNIMDNV